MDELKRKFDMLSVLSRKNDIDVKGLLKKFNLSKEKCEQAELSLNQTNREINACNKKISEEYRSQINVQTIAFLNRYAEKLETEAKQKTMVLNDAKAQMKSDRSNLEKELVKGVAYSKSLENASFEYNKSQQKSFDNNVEDIWLSSRRRG